MDNWGGEGGKYIFVCKVCWVWGHAPPGNFDFGPIIRCNLVESGMFSDKHLKLYIIDLHVK